MTDKGILDYIDRICGTYPLQYKGFTQEEMKRIVNEAKRNFQAYPDDDVHDALTAYINGPDSKMPPSPGQLKALMSKKTETDTERDWDKTRLVVDEEGRLFYNQLYTVEKSETDPGRKVFKPLPDSRPFDGKKGYTPVRVPRTDEELVGICKKRGWSYKVTVTPEGKKRYEFDQRLYDYAENEKFTYSLDEMTRRAFKSV